MALSRAWYKVPIITPILICQKRATLENCVLYLELRRIFCPLSGANEKNLNYYDYEYHYICLFYYDYKIMHLFPYASISL
ncbi:hypothetical protein BpHYR1_018594 [Brachionus plicatilis]|uniref:Uncharacterized protein n=1 Tax=Brachionus plicatilis TaxID=10195 RepID=A0A3M7PM49_BRAPC|nr:hypothetical protein BpHYR1_018594 [Brachionus plicatilis]